jgi:hypothetical protein
MRRRAARRWTARMVFVFVMPFLGHGQSRHREREHRGDG